MRRFFLALTIFLALSFLLPQTISAYEDQTDCETKCATSCVEDEFGAWQCTSDESISIAGTCKGGFVMGEKEPVVTEVKCGRGYVPQLETKQDTYLKFIPGTVRAECKCVLESQTKAPPKFLCSKEFKPCTSDAECKAGGTGCEKHVCIDLKPQTLPGLSSIGGEPVTKRCLAADSPYGRQYSKAFETAKASEPLKCGPGDKGINTALGCIPVGSTNEFVGWFLRWAIGIAGGVAFILMLIAGFQIMTAAGNPERLQGGRELLNAAVSGLVLIIFSVFLLKLIGVDILALPGFKAP